MPPLPQGMVKRRRRTSHGATVTYYWRRTVDGKDQRIALGEDYDRARARFDALRQSPPPLRTAPVAEASPTVESFARRWLAEYAATKRTERGRSQAEQRFRDYLWPHVGALPMSELKPADIRQLNATLEGLKVGLVTRRRLLEDFRCCLNYATQEADVLKRSPWRRGMLPVLPETVPEPLNDLELAEVVRVAPERWKSAALLLAHTGLRWGELRALRWEDVRDAPYPHLVVSRSHSGPTKSRKAREVPLLPEAEAALSALERGRGRVLALPETASWLRRYVRRHARLPGLREGFHVHRLRHTFACRWLERGGSKETLQSLLGHSTVRLTERYGRLSAVAVAAEVARLSARDSVAGAMDGTQDGTVRVSEG